MITAGISTCPISLRLIGSDMGWLFEVLPFEAGSRLTGIWDAGVDDDGEDLCVCVTKVALGAGQDPVVEASFLGAHLPYRFGGINGVGPEGRPWTVLLQVAPAEVAQRVGAISDFWPMLDGLDRALRLNPEARIESSGELRHPQLLGIYESQGVDVRLVADWPVGDLLRGLLAECCNVPLDRIVRGRLTQCAYPDRPHDCEHDVFREVFAMWTAQALNREK